MKMLRATKSDAASSNDTEKGMMMSGMQETRPAVTATLTVPSLLTRNGIVGSATRERSCAAAIQKPTVPSETPNFKLYHVGRSWIIVPKPSPEIPIISENFAIFDHEVTIPGPRSLKDFSLGLSLDTRP